MSETERWAWLQWAWCDSEPMERGMRQLRVWPLADGCSSEGSVGGEDSV